MVTLPPQPPFCRFWKRAGFVPVYLRQTPVSEALGRGGVGVGFAVDTEPRLLLAVPWAGVSVCVVVLL